MGRDFNISFGYGTNLVYLEIHVFEDETGLGPLKGRASVERTAKPYVPYLFGTNVTGGLLGLSPAKGCFLSDLRNASEWKWDGIFSLDLEEAGGVMDFGHPKGNLTWLSSIDPTYYRIEGELAGIPFKANFDSGEYSVSRAPRSTC